MLYEVITLAVALAAVVLFVDLDRYKPRLEAAASEALGLEVRIRGRITSYNVCYTKLLRLGILQTEAYRTAKKRIIREFTENPERPAVRCRAVGLGATERREPQLAQGESRGRITSYNVCYTKLLRP